MKAAHCWEYMVANISSNDDPNFTLGLPCFIFKGLVTYGVLLGGYSIQTRFFMIHFSKKLQRELLVCIRASTSLSLNEIQWNDESVTVIPHPEWKSFWQNFYKLSINLLVRRGEPSATVPFVPRRPGLLRKSRWASPDPQVVMELRFNQPPSQRLIFFWVLP